MQLSVLVLGKMDLHWAGASLPFATNTARVLLAYLAVEADRPHQRETLAALFWPDQSQALAFANLRQTLVRVRKALPDPAIVPMLEVTQQTIALRRDAITVDLTQFEELLATCAGHAHAAIVHCRPCIARLEQAAALYRGELLAGVFLSGSQAFDEWLLFRREALHRQALDALQLLTRAHEAVGDYARMRESAVRQLALEPWREEAHVELMRALALGGNRTAALTQYDLCRRLLADELGVEPSVETRALLERIRAGELRPEVPAAVPLHNLPVSLTPFVGRDPELAELAELWRDPEIRLVTLVGAGGMGKTRLALEVARVRLTAFPDGVFFVELAPLAAAESIASAIARTLGVPLNGSDPTAALLWWLSAKQLLLILDNFEHLLAGAGMVAEFLKAAPRVQIIVTSRERLNVRGEQVFGVDGLEYGRGAPAAAAAGSAAMRLFVQCARRAHSGFQLHEAELPALRRICELVGGMPLGLELAAAWIGELSPEEVAHEITRDLNFLEAQWPDAPERQRSMRAIFDWSWRLLSEAERQVLCQLSVFRGGFTRKAAEVIAGATLRVLASLHRKSLLHWRPADAATGRYELHELVRQFVAEQLDVRTDERAAVAARHGAYYLQFVADRGRRLGRDEPRAATAEIRTELDNVRQAWNWGVDQRRVAELAQAAYGWWQFCLLTGQDRESRRTFGLAVERLRGAPPMSGDGPAMELPPRGLSTLLAIHANHLFSNAPYEQMAAAARDAIRLGAASGDVEGETLGTFVLGRALLNLEQYRDANAMWERTLQLARGYLSGSPDSELLHEAEWLACILQVGFLLFSEEYAPARARVTEALQIAQALHKRRAEVESLASLAMIDFYMGDDLAAQRRYEQVLALARALDDRWGAMRVERLLSEVLRVQGAYEEARTCLSAMVATARELDILYEEILALASLVRLHCQLGDTGGARSWRDQLVERMTRTGVPHNCEAEGLRACAVYALCSGDEPRALADAERAWELAQRFNLLYGRADSAVILGHARAALHQPDAVAAYDEAVRLYLKIDNTASACEPQAGLAGLALAQGDGERARMLVDGLLPVLVERPRARVLTPFYAYTICYRVLAAHADPRAVLLLQTAQQHLRDAAGEISDPTLCQAFLEHPAAHRELLELAPPNALRA